jgi:hypothetical protein
LNDILEESVGNQLSAFEKDRALGNSRREHRIVSNYDLSLGKLAE